MSKIKDLIKEYGKTALGIGVGIAAGGIIAAVSYKAGGDYTERCIAIGLKKFHESGVMKFFNPDTGLEVSENEVCKIVESKFAK